MNENQLFHFNCHVISNWDLFKKLSIQLIFISFFGLKGFTQEKIVELTNNPRVYNSDSLQQVKSDSLRKAEAMRLYATPVETLKGKKENGNLNSPPKIHSNQ